LFLDEPTTGLDPQSRRQIWGLVANYRAHGGTVVLTTHYMEEAQRLCDRVAILDRGRLIRLGTPAELIAGLGAEHVVELELEAGVGQGALDEATLRGLPTVIEAHLSGEGVWTLAAVEPEQAVPALRTLLQERGQHLVRLVTRKATLEDVFVSLTGRALRDG
jgi:ABC-2 type transport system ATP-binding protein